MTPRRPQQEENVDAWLMSYADMITLLLCFFIIFVSVSEPRKDKMAAIADGMQKQFGLVDLSTPFQGVFRSLQTIVESHQILKDVAVEKTETSIAMEISTLAFFKTDSADFQDDKMPILIELVNSLKGVDFLDYRITVEGHTSDVPINTTLFPSNWELSADRAARMVRFFIEQGMPAERMRVVGYGDTQPKVPNLDANRNPIDENREKNQRLVIKLERVM